MNTLIIKLGATGDVVRTTPLLKKMEGDIHWITAAKNLPLLNGLAKSLHPLPWEQRETAIHRRYDLVINLEDTLPVAQFARALKFKQIFGSYVDAGGHLKYTEDARGWFDLSLISRFGRENADRLKLNNRRTYQDLIFDGLKFLFLGESYLLPAPVETGLVGDVAISPCAGPVWPMKNWAGYGELKEQLESEGLVVNVLPERATLLEHLADVRNHRCLVSGDSLPMHFALGVGTSCVTLFNCTSPWEIHDYSLQHKIISPRLEKFFYQRGLDQAATTAITVDEVHAAVMKQLHWIEPAVHDAHPSVTAARATV
jgi:ADP-heptose:LPS heptosyltransferase